MSAADLDPVIHAPKRMAAMAMLSSADQASFQFLKEQLNLTDSDLSKQMSALQNAGYVTTSKLGRGRGATTTFSLTRRGKTAFTAYRTALRNIIGD